MRKSLLIRFGASALLSATLGVGLVHAAGGNIENTGPHSNNQIQFRGQSSFRESNNTNVSVDNHNYQSARSGDAVVRGNTYGGNATSGDASNYNTTSTNVSTGSTGVNYVAPERHDVSATISDTGPHSNNQIGVSDRNTVNISNHNSVNVSNSNYQTARSGNAIVSGNTYGGNATSGDASNYNSTSTNVNVGSGSSYATMPANHYASAPVTYSHPVTPVYSHANSYTKHMDYHGSSNSYCCSTHTDAYTTESHQTKHYPVHHDYPKSSGGMHGYNPCGTCSEVSYVRHDDKPCDTYGYAHKVVPVVHYVSHPCQQYRPVYVKPCAVISHPVVRPPCPVVVAPYHRQIDCGHSSYHQTPRCESNYSHGCGQNQHNRSCW